MQSLERHALYNLIRMNWLNDPQLSVEPWQIEDYRILPTPVLFERLKNFSIDLDRITFAAYADECDSPEELSEHLIGDRPLDTKSEDQIYLLVFELWRKIMLEKPSLSILCNELDYQIYLNDRNESKNSIDLQDALGNFALLLNENVDEGISSQEALNLLTPYFANDIENFLYDYIYQLIDEDSESYAQELLDNFAPYLKGNKWFELLYIKLIEHSNNKLANKMLLHLMEDYLDEKDIDFNLELLSFLINTGNNADFKALVEATIPLLINEEDFQDLISLCSDLLHRSDEDDKEKILQNILRKRNSIHPEKPLDPTDKDLKTLVELIRTID